MSLHPVEIVREVKPDRPVSTAVHVDVRAMSSEIP